MPTNGKTPILDMKYNVDYDVEILDYKEGENNYGPWHFYQMKYDGDRYGHFAQSELHKKLKNCRNGDIVTIRKEQTDKDGYEWIVQGENTIQAGFNKPVQPPQSTWDDRTHDIHHQVCLKVAVMSFPASDRPWNNEVVQELKRRTDSLMVVLEGDRDDLPF